MFTLIIGGSASGKSRYAESLFGPGTAAPRFYIATMGLFDQECQARTARHKAQRAGRGFETVERCLDLAGLELPKGSQALLEDMGNLVANELYSPGGAGPGTAKAVLAGIDRLTARCGELVVVSNEVFLGGRDYVGDTLHYMKALAEINRAMAARADRAVEVVCGLTVFHKGGAGLCG